MSGVRVGYWWLWLLLFSYVLKELGDADLNRRDEDDVEFVLIGFVID